MRASLMRHLRLGASLSNADDRHPLCAECAGEGMECRAHDIRRRHLVAHDSQNMIEHLTAAKHRGNLGFCVVLFGDVDPQPTHTDLTAVAIQQWSSRQGNTRQRAIGSFQPGPQPPDRLRCAKWVEATTVGRLRQQPVGWLAEQGHRRPAQRRIGHDKAETPDLVRLECEIGCLVDQVAPALPAVEQCVAQRCKQQIAVRVAGVARSGRCLRGGRLMRSSEGGGFIGTRRTHRRTILGTIRATQSPHFRLPVLTKGFHDAHDRTKRPHAPSRWAYSLGLFPQSHATAFALTGDRGLSIVRRRNLGTRHR